MKTIFFLIGVTLLNVTLSYNNGLGIRPRLAWNTWCSIEKCGTDICNEWELESIATAMKSNGMYDMGYNRIEMDDCWTACTRDSNGQIQPDPDRFPSGMASLADKLHNMGFLFGLYTSAGTTTCSSGTRHCPNGSNPPGSYGHYADDAKTFANWQMDMVKIDWCGSELNNAQQQHTEFSNDLNATGRHIWLELCRGYSYPPPPYVRNVSQSWRITGDHHDEWSSTANAIEQSANSTFLSFEYGWGYNDFLMTGGQGCNDDSNPNITHPHCPGQTDNEYITEFSMWSIIGSPLVVATDVRNFTEIMKTVLLNKEVIDVNQVYEYPGGNIIPSQTVNCDNSVHNACQVWSRQINETSAAIVLYNAGENSHEINVDLSNIPNMKWSSNTNLFLRDLWKHSDIGTMNGKYSATVASHGVVFITATQQ